MASLSHRGAETPEQSLARIQGGFSNNDLVVIEAFAERGIDPADIEPRVNVLTFNAWKAKGRRVAKGATSVRVQTWIPVKGKEGEPTTKDGKRSMRPKLAFLFHESQTIAVDAKKGTRPDAWQNPHLVKAGTYEPDTNGIQDLDSEQQTPVVTEVPVPLVPPTKPKDDGFADVDLSLANFVKPKREALPDIGKPEPGKQYNLSGIANGKTWAESEVTA